MSIEVVNNALRSPGTLLVPNYLSDPERIINEIYNNNDLKDMDIASKIKHQTEKYKYICGVFASEYEKEYRSKISKAKRLLSFKKKEDYKKFQSLTSEALSAFKKLYGCVKKVNVDKVIMHVSGTQKDEGKNNEGSEEYRDYKQKKDELEELKKDLRELNKSKENYDDLLFELRKILHALNFNKNPDDFVEDFVRKRDIPETEKNSLKQKWLEKIKSKYKILTPSAGIKGHKLKEIDTDEKVNKTVILCLEEVLDGDIIPEKDSKVKEKENEVKAKEKEIKNSEKVYRERAKRPKNATEHSDTENLRINHSELLRTLENSIVKLTDLNKKIAGNKSSGVDNLADLSKTLGIKSSGNMVGFGNQDASRKVAELESDKSELEEYKNSYAVLARKYVKLGIDVKGLKMKYKFSYPEESSYRENQERVQEVAGELELTINNITKILQDTSHKGLDEIWKNMPEKKKRLVNRDQFDKYSDFANICEKKLGFAKEIGEYYIFDANMGISNSEVKSGKIPDKYMQWDTITENFKKRNGQLQTCLQIAQGNNLITQYTHTLTQSSYYNVIDRAGNLVKEAAFFKGRLSPYVCINNSSNEKEACEQVKDAMKKSLEAGEWKSFS